MKGFILSFGLVALALSSNISIANGNFSKPSINFSFWNPVTVYNDAPYDVQYSFSSHSGGNFYLLPKGVNEVYHSGVGDNCAEIIIVACTEKSKEGKCLNVVTHLSPVFYNVDLIKDVHILSVTNIKVTCLDGGMLSCIVK